MDVIKILQRMRVNLVQVRRLGDRSGGPFLFIVLVSDLGDERVDITYMLIIPSCTILSNVKKSTLSKQITRLAALQVTPIV